MSLTRRVLAPATLSVLLALAACEPPPPEGKVRVPGRTAAGSAHRDGGTGAVADTSSPDVPTPRAAGEAPADSAP